MAYPTNALATLAELKDTLRVAGTAIDTTFLETLANGVTGIFNEIADSDIVTRLGAGEFYKEWHDLAVPQGYLDVRHSPIREIVSLQSGLPGTLFTFDADDYVFDAEHGRVMLKRGAVNPGAWRPPGFIDYPEDYFTRGLGTKTGAGFNPGVGAAFVEYKGGFESSTTVPWSLKRAWLDVAARIYRSEENKSQGKAQEIAAGLSIATKFNESYISPEAMAMIRRFAYHGKTARRTVEVGS